MTFFSGVKEVGWGKQKKCMLLWRNYCFSLGNAMGSWRNLARTIKILHLKHGYISSPLSFVFKTIHITPCYFVGRVGGKVKEMTVKVPNIFQQL